MAKDVDSSVDLRVTTVREGTRTPVSNTVQTLTVGTAPGSFNLTVLGTTITVNTTDTAAQLQAALSLILNPNNSNPNLPYTNNVAVSRFGNVFMITFQGEHRAYAITAANIVPAGLGYGDSRHPGQRY